MAIRAYQETTRDKLFKAKVALARALGKLYASASEAKSAWTDYAQIIESLRKEGAEAYYLSLGISQDLELVDDLELPNSVLNTLKRNSITRIVHLIAMTEQELLELRYLGEKGLRVIKGRLSEHNLSLGMAPPPAFFPEGIERDVKSLLDNLDLDLLQEQTRKLESP